MFDAEILKGNVKNLMDEQNIGPTQLSRESGVNLGTIKQIVSGKSKNPTIQNLVAIADVFDLTLDKLIGRSVLGVSEDEPLNEKFLEAALDVLKAEIQSQDKDITLAEWYDALRDIYVGIASATRRTKESTLTKRKATQ